MELHVAPILLTNKKNCMKTILVATDFSPAALNALNYSADMALSINANLLLLTVVQSQVGYSDIPIVLSLEDLLRSAEKEINQLKEALMLRTNNKIKIETEVGMGAFFYELENVCDRIKPYIVVIGTHGKTALEQMMFGAHAVHAMKNLTWPLITVPPWASFSKIKKIGLASDLNKVMETTPIDEIKMLVKDFKAELHILNTAKRNVFSPRIVFESGMLQEMLTDLEPKYHFIENDNTDKGIIYFAEMNRIDLLVVLPKRHNLFEKLMHKSHTKQLVLHSHIPVMALH